MALCKVCGTSDMNLFYSSIKTYCKEHWKMLVRKNRIEKIEHYRTFDKARASMPHRVAARLEYANTPKGVAAHNRAKFKWSERNKKKRHVAIAVNNAVRDKKITKPDSCQECGKVNCRIEGHHDDYTKPMEVRWLCSTCHRAWHKANGSVEYKEAA